MVGKSKATNLITLRKKNEVFMKDTKIMSMEKTILEK